MLSFPVLDSNVLRTAAADCSEKSELSIDVDEIL